MMDPSDVSISGELLLSDLLQCLVECSEKAAKIAQIFREENDLFDLLVQEKSPSESNKSFKDFKTLADVLVQETIKLDVGRKFPQLVPQMRGEEQNSFQNARGECVEVVVVDSSADQTADMLAKVLDGRKHFARAVADVVHSADITCERQCSATDAYSVDTLGIWIDPIDSTAEYIEGKEGGEGMQPYGLRCVCVLIGAYDLQTFQPLLGVVNQPFYSKEVSHQEEKWKSKFYWGMNASSPVSSSVQLSSNLRIEPSSELSAVKERTVVIGSSESPELREVIRREYRVVHAAGAGHKALLVAAGTADLYILSKSSTYFWDTCGPHAILSAAGGGMLRLKEAMNGCEEMNLKFLTKWQIKYEPASSKSGTKAFQNCDGILAYRDPKVALSFISFLKNSNHVFC